jgi:glutathionylspermidine synthase
MDPSPLSCGRPLAEEAYQRLVRRAIFECCKWHIQVEDQPILCPFPLVLRADTWHDLARQAEALYGEALAAEQELLQRPELHECLGLPPALRLGLAQIPANGPAPGGARVARFDFHWTAAGWRISEGNTDAAGGFIESSGVTQLMAEHHADLEPAGDPAGAWVDAVLRATGPRSHVGLLHVTIYTEDRQMLIYLARRLHERGLNGCLLAPGQFQWIDGQAYARSDWYAGPLDLLFRFFPAEWLPGLSSNGDWHGFLAGQRTPLCNPGYAALTQSKRFALVWERLLTPLPTWRVSLPETRSPSALDGNLDDWVLKPALGHEGMDIGIAGGTEQTELEAIRRAARRHADFWAAQRRFDVVPLMTPDGPLYPSLGVYVIAGRAAGVYGRVSPRPLIDDTSREIVVLVRKGA